MFVIQYKDKAEYLRIKYSERRSKETSEPAARVTLWDDTMNVGRDSLGQGGVRARAATVVEPSPGADFSDDESVGGAMAFGDDDDAAPVARAGSMAFNQAGVAAKGQQLLRDNFQKKKEKSSDVPTPVFDEFLQAFIITKHDKSFYLDLEGNFNTDCRTIKWP